jgi:hypothetical protein
MLREKRSPDAWDAELYFSHACLHPEAQQAPMLGDYPRHPYAGRRPDHSGYCVWAEGCHCECHEWNQADEVDLPEFDLDDLIDKEVA